MSAEQLISLAIQGSMALMVFCVGLSARGEDVAYLLRKPGLLARSLVAMNVIMPVVAVVIALTFDFDRPLKAALIALSVSPVPPILPGTQLKGGGRESYVIGLLAVAAIVSVVFVPIAASVIGNIFGEEVRTSPSTIARIIGTSILAPLLLGLVVRRIGPSIATQIARPLSIFATVLLAVAFVPVLLKIWPAIVAAIGNYTLVTIVVFVLIGLVVGHLLGGPASEDRSVLALATASRHPAVALAVVHESAELLPVLGIVLVALVVGSVLSALYLKWSARSDASTDRQRQAG